MNILTDLGSDFVGCIVATSGGSAVLSETEAGSGVLVRAFEGLGGDNIAFAVSCEVSTSGECSVKTSTCVAGDWFTSDSDGLAVKTETGFALGRILADPVDGLALCVITPVYLA